MADELEQEKTTSLRFFLDTSATFQITEYVYTYQPTFG